MQVLVEEAWVGPETAFLISSQVMRCYCSRQQNLNPQAWGTFNKCWGLTPDQLHQNLWLVGPEHPSVLSDLKTHLG